MSKGKYLKYRQCNNQIKSIELKSKVLEDKAIEEKMKTENDELKIKELKDQIERAKQKNEKLIMRRNAAKKTEEDLQRINEAMNNSLNQMPFVL
jgi:uncharacterized protein (DUF3084 family)